MAPLITRMFRKGDTLSSALYSRCGAYRYALSRHWLPDAPPLLFVLLNPSTATEQRNDPTLARCEARARRMGFGGVCVVNLYAFRATDPRLLRHVADPVGPMNDAVLEERLVGAALVICGWGGQADSSGFPGRGESVLGRILAAGQQPHHLGLTRAGQPMHPLYRPLGLLPQPWDQAAISEMSEAVSPTPPVTTPIA
jgi:hypothetical protein